MTFKPLVNSLVLVAALLVALALITDALASRREAAIAVAFPPVGQIITVNGVGVHALTKGSGPSIRPSAIRDSFKGPLSRIRNFRLTVRISRLTQ